MIEYPIIKTIQSRPARQLEFSEIRCGFIFTVRFAFEFEFDIGCHLRQNCDSGCTELLGHDQLLLPLHVDVLYRVWRHPQNLLHLGNIQISKQS